MVILKIAYMMYSLPTVVSPTEKCPCSKGDLTQKLSSWEQLSKHGHTIDIFGDVRGDYSKYKYGKVYPISEGYYPTSDKYDLLIVENGVANIMFENTTTHRKYFVETHELLLKWHGKVIYLHYDPSLPMYMDLDEFHSPKWIEQSGGLSTKDLLKDREFYIVTLCQDTEAFRDYYWDKYRVCYKYAKGFYSTMLSTHIHKEDNMKVNKNTEYYQIYLGNNIAKSRARKLMKFYGHQKCKVDIFGKWNENKMEKFPKVHFHEPIPQMETFDKYNKSMFTVCIADQKGELLDVVGNILWESVQSGCIAFVDKDLKTVSKIIGSDFAVGSIEEALDWVPDVDDYKKRREINEYQLHRCEKSGMYEIFGIRMDEILKEVMNN